jgi:hypothetical protein
MKNEILLLLQTNFSKAKALEMAQDLITDIDSFHALIQIIQLNEQKLSARASWVLQEMIKMNFDVSPSQLAMLIDVVSTTKIDGVKRNILSSLQLIDIAEEVIGELSDYCFSILVSSKETVAVKVYAMQIAANACKKYPELTSELLTCIELELPKNSVSFYARAKRVRKELEKIK